VRISGDSSSNASGDAGFHLMKALGDTSEFTVQVWGMQLEEAETTSSYIPTINGTMTREADKLYFDFDAPPQEMTVYTKHIETGTFQMGNLGSLWSIGGSAATDFFIHAYVSGDVYRVVYANGGTSEIELTTSPNMGDLVEVLGHLYSDGDVKIEQSINGGSVESSGLGSGASLQSVFNEEKLYLGSRGTLLTMAGIGCFQKLVVINADQTMEEMRSWGPPPPVFYKYSYETNVDMVHRHEVNADGIRRHIVRID